MDVFNFMMKEGYSHQEIKCIEQKFECKLQFDLRLSLLLAQAIRFPLIFENNCLMDDHFETCLNTHRKDLFVKPEIATFSYLYGKESHHE